MIPGGTTKYGIDQASHPGVDVANLTQDQAVAIYHQEWLAHNLDALPDKLAIAAFDVWGEWWPRGPVAPACVQRGDASRIPSGAGWGLGACLDRRAQRLHYRLRWRRSYRCSSRSGTAGLRSWPRTPRARSSWLAGTSGTPISKVTLRHDRSDPKGADRGTL